MGTTVQVEQGRWSFLDAYLILAGVGQAGISPIDVDLVYKKYGDLSFSTKPINGARTQLVAAADFGDLTLSVADSSRFPRTIGTLILDPAGASEIIDFTANNTATGVLNVPTGIQTAGVPAFTPGTVVQFSYATALTYTVAAGVTGIVVDDSSIFPPGFGRIRIYNVTTSEIVEVSANVTSNNTLAFTTALVNPFTAGDKVELIEWYELGSGPNGYYSVLFSPTDLDTLDQFLYILGTQTPPPAVSAFDQFERTIDVIRATSADTEAAPTLATCVIKDHILNLSGVPLQNTGVSARLLALPTLISGVGVYDEIVSTTTDANGFFQLTLIQGATVDVVIPATGYRRTIVVPSSTFANLFEI